MPTGFFIVQSRLRTSHDPDHCGKMSDNLILKRVPREGDLVYAYEIELEDPEFFEKRYINNINLTFILRGNSSEEEIKKLLKKFVLEIRADGIDLLYFRLFGKYLTTGNWEEELNEMIICLGFPLFIKDNIQKIVDMFFAEIREILKAFARDNEKMLTLGIGVCGKKHYPYRARKIQHWWRNILANPNHPVGCRYIQHLFDKQKFEKLQYRIDIYTGKEC